MVTSNKILAFYFVDITNWKEMVNQFGLDKAKELSKKLRISISNSKDENPDHLAIDFDSVKTEAVVLFEFVERKPGRKFVERENAPKQKHYVYTYCGTAN